MIVPVPRDETRQALVDGDARFEAEIAARDLDIGVGLLDVAGLHVLENLDRLASAGRLDHRDEVHQVLGAVIAQVVEPVRRLRASPGTVLRRVVERGQHAGHDIVDIGEVAPHVALIENPDRLAGEDRLGEKIGRHVGPPPGPIDGEESQAGRGQTIEMGVAVGDELASPLGRRIERDRLSDRILYRKR